MFSIIAAVSNTNGLGKNGQIPWNEPVDMKYFKEITSKVSDATRQNAIIMGRRTYESLNGRTLPNRRNIVISSDCNNTIDWFTSLQSAMDYLWYDKSIEKIFVIGGGQLYQEAIRHRGCNELYINLINTDAECDVFFPEINNDTYELCSEHALSERVTARHYRNKYPKWG
jgi:dihydrofolate reductase/thymidylate synthase